MNNNRLPILGLLPPPRAKCPREFHAIMKKGENVYDNEYLAKDPFPDHHDGFCVSALTKVTGFDCFHF
jgi:hypothetical protein